MTKTIEQLKSEIAALETAWSAESAKNKRFIAIDRVMNEGGEGYSQYENAQEASAEKFMPQIRALKDQAFAIEWTPEVTAARRAVWNAEMNALSAAKKQVTTKMLDEIESRLGFKMSALKQAIGK